MAQLEALTKRRSTIKGTLTKIGTYVLAQRKLNASLLDIEELKIRLRRADNLLSEFCEVEQAINVLKIDDVNQQDEFEDKYYSAVAGLNKLLRSANMACGNVSVDLNDTLGEPARNTKIEVKLPKINIAPFSGSYTEWQSFYDIFA